MTILQHRTNKVGVIAWRRRLSDELEFLIMHPHPKPDPARPGFALNGNSLEKEASAMQWGLARGTVQKATKTGNAVEDDIRTMEELQSLAPKEIEPIETTMWREVEEELGITREDAENMHDEGLYEYTSTTEDKGTYRIHFYSLRCTDIMLSTLRKRSSAHAQNVSWKSVREIEAMVQQKMFKPGYLPILKAVSEAINSRPNL